MIALSGDYDKARITIEKFLTESEWRNTFEKCVKQL